MIAESWQGTNFEEWKLSKLKILQKKEDLSDPNNWRPIMLLDVLQKIMIPLIAQRLQGLLKVVGIVSKYLIGREQRNALLWRAPLSCRVTRRNLQCSAACSSTAQSQ